MRKLEVIMQEVSESKAAIERLEKALRAEQKTLLRLRSEARKAVEASFAINVKESAVGKVATE